jgi:hypothetical protein
MAPANPERAPEKSEDVRTSYDKRSPSAALTREQMLTDCSIFHKWSEYVNKEDGRRVEAPFTKLSNS